MDFATFDEQVRRIAGGLQGLGVGHGDRIVVFAPNCHRFVELYWAAAYLGAAVVPLEARLTDDDIAFIVESVSPVLGVGGSKTDMERLGPLLPDASVRCSFEGAEAPVVAFDDLLNGQVMASPSALVDRDTPMLIMYTAAVEGRPKGAVITHGNLLAQAAQTSHAVGIGPGSRHGVLLPLTHTFGAYLMFVATCNAVCNTTVGAFDAMRVAEAMREGLITYYAAFAPMGERILGACESIGVDPGERLAFVTGLEVPDTVVRYLRASVPYYCMYGQTEAAGMVAIGRVDAQTFVPNYSGTMMDGTRLSLRDEHGAEVEPGQAGEAWLKGETIVTCYWPDLPTRITDDGWLQTGDVMRRDSEGGLYFVSRTGDKDLIKPGGLNVYPAEVEQVLLRHSSVSGAFVFGEPDPTWRERVCAVVRVDGDLSDDLLQELDALCRTSLASFKRPSVIEVADERYGDAASLTRSVAAERYREIHRV
jgi:long-chain acyl-CoA synthetase